MAFVVRDEVPSFQFELLDSRSVLGEDGKLRDGLIHGQGLVFTRFPHRA